ncbi:sugar phosphate isomerase/epimerase family protein [Paenibacillus xanthanilyticus]|uniref:Sugar phosphate isomerase/epimerase family protein n=1 Tax=Paenibacillus xanthanilyticus TaxID=1783531 RepID=A0ABV8K1X4_9BACL
MKLSFCTITFRHQLVSFERLVEFACRQRFDGIELWGAHAVALAGSERERTSRQLAIMHSRGLRVTMLSDYLDIADDARFEATVRKLRELAQLARWYGTDRIRTFAGSKPSADVAQREREAYAARLRTLSGICADYGLQLLTETHPNTLSDNLASTRRLLEEVDHPNFGVNLDFLHLWEAGDDPLASYAALKPKVGHFHMKNVASAERLTVFAPDQVYAPSGSREGMVPLSQGALDYAPILAAIRDSDLFASLEWFGGEPFRVLEEDRDWIEATCGIEAARNLYWTAAGAGG